MLKNIDFTTTISMEEFVVKKNIILGDDFDYLFIGNIPPTFKSADLRFFFIEFIEKGAFKCFHYRHRPETQIVKSDSSIQKEQSTEDKTCCCVLKVFTSFIDRILTKYNGKEWRKRNLEFCEKKVLIKKLQFKSHIDPSKEFKTKGELRNENHTDDQDIHFEDLRSMIELNPPENIMPNGNIGTPTKYFHKLIRECKMPSSVIKSLGLEFPKSRSMKAYSKVPLKYDINKTLKSIEDHGLEKILKNSSKYKSCSSSETDKDGSLTHIDPLNNDEYGTQKVDNDTKPNSDDEEDREAEDWERYEALHDDVDNQARPKAKDKLYEEDLEVKWEKGGSGLVFYTDAFYWNELKGKDFDEDTVDDWDVDYSVYYEDGAGDKPARDQLLMRLEKRRRQGKQDGPIKYSQIRRKEKHNREKMTNSFAEFEKHSKGFGSRILKQQGWKEGSGVGASRKGISEPIDLEGQAPRARIGLGYYGEKLDRTVCLKRKAERDVYISTIYDDKDGEELDAMRFHGQELLKYRPVAIKFHNQPKLNSSTTDSVSVKTTPEIVQSVT